MAELRTAVGTLISKQRELSSSYASPISAARSAPRSRPASSARTGAAAASISAGPASAPSPPSAASATSSRPACSQCRRNASTVTVNPLGRLTPARSSSARRPILAPQTPTASSGATSSTQAMASGTGNQPCPFGACLSTVTRPVVPSTSTSSPSADDHRGQPDRGHRGHAVLASDDGRVRQGAAAVAHAGGDLGEGRGPVRRGGLADQHLARAEPVQFVGVVQDAGGPAAGALGGGHAGQRLDLRRRS